MNEQKIRRLIKLVEESNIESLEIRPFLRTAIKITKTRFSSNNGASPPESPALINGLTPTPAPAGTSLPPAATEAARPSHLVEVTAPMVGTLYLAPSPDATPFVEVGQVVKPGDVLCIIEAMKLMNEIEAEHGGRISEILIENAHPVEFGQALFLIDPTVS